MGTERFTVRGATYRLTSDTKARLASHARKQDGIRDAYFDGSELVTVESVGHGEITERVDVVDIFETHQDYALDVLAEAEVKPEEGVAISSGTVSLAQNK